MIILKAVRAVIKRRFSSFKSQRNHPLWSLAYMPLTSASLQAMQNHKPQAPAQADLSLLTPAHLNEQFLWPGRQVYPPPAAARCANRILEHSVQTRASSTAINMTITRQRQANVKITASRPASLAPHGTARSGPSPTDARPPAHGNLEGASWGWVLIRCERCALVRTRRDVLCRSG